MDKIKKVDVLPFEVMKIVGERKSDIATRLHVAPFDVMGDDNGFVVIKHGGGHMHTVLPGETLTSIAQKYGTTVQEIKQKNNILFIFVGQQLVI